MAKRKTPVKRAERDDDEDVGLHGERPSQIGAVAAGELLPALMAGRASGEIGEALNAVKTKRVGQWVIKEYTTEKPLLDRTVQKAGQMVTKVLPKLGGEKFPMEKPETSAIRTIIPTGIKALHAVADEYNKVADGKNPLEVLRDTPVMQQMRHEKHIKAWREAFLGRKDD